VASPRRTNDYARIALATIRIVNGASALVAPRLPPRRPAGDDAAAYPSARTTAGGAPAASLAAAAFRRVRRLLFQRLRMPGDSWNPSGADMEAEARGRVYHLELRNDEALWGAAPVVPRTPPNPLRNDVDFRSEFPCRAEPHG